MKKINSIMVLLIGILLLSNTCFAVDETSVGTSKGEFIKVGAAGAQFLKMEIGARANGMAGAYCSAANDLTSMFWNPAGLADVKQIAGEFAYTQWFAGFSNNFAAVAMPLGGQFVAGLSFTNFVSDYIPVTTVDKPDGTGAKYTVSDMAIGATISGYLTDQFSFGATFKYVQTAFSSLSANGIAFDVGTMYQTGIQGIKLGFSIHNFGGQETYDGVDLRSIIKPIQEMNQSALNVSYLSSAFNIPLIFRGGISSEIINNDEIKWIGSMDYVTHSDVADQFCIGTEVTWHDLLSIRGGYKFGQDQIGLGGGVGIKYIGGGFSGRFDYSINPTKDIGLVNRITVFIGLN